MRNLRIQIVNICIIYFSWSKGYAIWCLQNSFFIYIVNTYPKIRVIRGKKVNNFFVFFCRPLFMVIQDVEFHSLYSGLPKAEGLRPKSKVSHLRLRLRLPKVYAAKGPRSSRRLKHLKFSKFNCKFCDKNFRMIKVHVCSVFKKVWNIVLHYFY